MTDEHGLESLDESVDHVRGPQGVRLIGLDLAGFDEDRAGEKALERVERDFRSGLESGQGLGTPTVFIGGVVHEGAFDAQTLLAALGR
jgi:protein-disulfide isomerase